LTKDEARKRCLEDAIFLGSKVLGYDVEEDPHGELFRALASARDKKLVLWPRGHFKTSCIVIKIVQEILKDPDVRILVMQHKLKVTRGWVKEIRSHFDGTNANSRLSQLFPEFCGEKRALLANAAQFTVPARKRKHLQQATVTAASPKAVETGQHYTQMYFDDLVTAGNFRNIEQLDKLESEYSHFLPLLDPGGLVFMTGTRYSHADLYARLIDKDKGNDEWEISIRECFVGPKHDKLLFPERVTKDGRKIGFTLELLAKLQRDDPEMFGPQYLNKITYGTHQLFPPALILSAVKSTKDPAFPQYSPNVFMIDPSGFAANALNDNSVLAVGAQDNFGRVWVKDVIGAQFQVYGFAVVLMQQFLKHRPWKVMIEKVPGAEVLGEYLKVIAEQKGLNLPIDYYKSGNKKAAKHLRISSLEGAFKNKTVFLTAGISDFEKLEEELTQYPRGRRDDRPDAVAMLVNFLQSNVPARAPIPGPSIYVTGLPDQIQEVERQGMSCGDGFTC
jgi:predicted phage terminase large subunit-like protein